jgi:transposase
MQNSGDTHHYGRITKKGNKHWQEQHWFSVFLLLKRYSSYLDAHYQRIKNRRGAPKAIIALARKFLDIIYKTLKYKWTFEDFPNFKLASQ